MKVKAAKRKNEKGLTNKYGAALMMGLKPWRKVVKYELSDLSI